MRLSPALRLTVVAALVASAVLFAVGAAIERHHEHSEHHAATPSRGKSAETGREAPSGESSGETHRRGGEHRGKQSGEPPRAGAETSGHRETASERRHETRSERIFGVNPDALPLVVGAVVVSLLLALAVGVRPETLVILGLVVAVGLGAAVFDVREAVHQADQSRTDVMVIAIVVAVLHLLAAGAAGLLARARLAPGTGNTA